MHLGELAWSRGAVACCLWRETHLRCTQLMSCAPTRAHSVHQQFRDPLLLSLLQSGVVTHAAEDLSTEEFAELKADAKFPGSRYPVNGLLRKVGQHPKGAALLKMLAQVSPRCSSSARLPACQLWMEGMCLGDRHGDCPAQRWHQSGQGNEHESVCQVSCTCWQAPLGGRLLYEFHLARIVSNVTAKLDPADQACIL